MTVIIPEFQLHEQTQIGKVVLKVANLEKMIAFYTQVIGLSLIEKNQQTARLGTTEKILLELIKVEKSIASHKENRTVSCRFPFADSQRFRQYTDPLFAKQCTDRWRQ